MSVALSAEWDSHTAEGATPFDKLRTCFSALHAASGSWAQFGLLGGLISQNSSRAETGIPLLKDIPGVGQLFRTNTDNNRKTEMLVLITPYIVADDHDAQEITDAFRSRLGEWAQPKKPLTPLPEKLTSGLPPGKPSASEVSNESVSLAMPTPSQ